MAQLQRSELCDSKSLRYNYGAYNPRQMNSRFLLSLLSEYGCGTVCLCARPCHSVHFVLLQSFILKEHNEECAGTRDLAAKPSPTQCSTPHKITPRCRANPRRQYLSTCWCFAPMPAAVVAGSRQSARGGMALNPTAVL